MHSLRTKQGSMSKSKRREGVLNDYLQVKSHLKVRNLGGVQWVDFGSRMFRKGRKRMTLKGPRGTSLLIICVEKVRVHTRKWSPVTVLYI